MPKKDFVSRRYFEISDFVPEGILREEIFYLEGILYPERHLRKGYLAQDFVLKGFCAEGF